MSADPERPSRVYHDPGIPGVRTPEELPPEEEPAPEPVPECGHPEVDDEGHMAPDRTERDERER